MKAVIQCGGRGTRLPVYHGPPDTADADSITAGARAAAVWLDIGRIDDFHTAQELDWGCSVAVI